MRIDLQAGLYNTAYNNFNHTSFKGEKTTEDKDKADIKDDNSPKKDYIDFIPIYSDKNYVNPLYKKSHNEGYDEGYDEGYETGRKTGSFFNRAAFIALAAIGAMHLYGDYKNEELRTKEQYYAYESLQNSIEQEFNDLKREGKISDEIMTEGLVTIILMLDEMNQQKISLEEQIKALPEDSKEAQALKEELKALEEEYAALEEKYQEYIKEYGKPDNDDEKEEKPDDNIMPVGDYYTVDV